MSAAGTVTGLPGSALRRVEDALEHHGCKRGKGGKWYCPVHDDRTPSLKVDTRDGRVLLHCFAGCTAEEITAAIDLPMSALFDDQREYMERATPRPASTRSTRATGPQPTPKRVAEYEYHDAGGDALRRKVRFEPGSDGRPKDFRWEKPTEQGWVTCRGDGNPEVLYRLPALMEALDAGDTVYLTAGEKDADRVVLEGWPATTNPEGEGAKWRAEYTEVFAGSDSKVCILADRDKPGAKHATEVLNALLAAGVRARCLEAVEGNDVSDHLAAGYSLEELTEIDPAQRLAELTEGTPAQWEPVIPLESVAVADFPVHALPTPLADFVRAEAAATQTPLDLAGSLVLAATSAANAGKGTVLVGGGHREPFNVFVAVGANPSELKTVVSIDVTKPLYDHEQNAVAEKRPAVAEAREKIALLRERRERARKKAAGGEDGGTEAERLAQEIAEAEFNAPHTPQLLTEDVTPEKLGALMAEQGGRMAVFSDEGGELFEIIAGRYVPNTRPNLGVFLKGHTGRGTLKIDRKGGSYHIENPTLTIGIAVQPSVIRDLPQAGIMRDRGLLSRFFYAMPHSLAGSRDWRREESVPAEVSGRYRAVLSRLLRLPLSTRDLLLSDAAHRAIIDFRQELEPKLGDGGELAWLADWVGKLAGGVARIAGNLHLAEHHTDPDPFASSISADTMERAIEIGRYYLTHAIAAFSAMHSDPAALGAAKIWRAIHRRSERDGGLTEINRSAIWDLVKKGQFEKSADLDAPLRLLVERNYLALREPPAGKPRGAPAKVHVVNPAALKLPLP